jgi:Uma2 family endonuclease
MGEPARHRATYADVEALPPDLVGEIVDGELYVSPRPAPKHAHTSFLLAADLGSTFDRDPEGPEGPGGWRFMFEPELHLDSGEPIVPDVAGWRYANMPELPEEAFITTPPDWICEILSPATIRLDRWIKKQKYAQKGVSFVWLIDPVAHTLEIFILLGDHYREAGVFQGDVCVRAVPFDAVELDLARWWRTRRG